jgi:glycosyltransferase involved in cell wall biosynthesis
MSQTQLSVIVPTFARPELLCRTLEGFCRQRDLNALAEVIVVSDGFDDGAATIARSFSDYLPIHFLDQPKRGVSSARNRGIASAKSPIVLLVDDDVVPGPDLIGEHVRFHEEREEESSALLGYVTWHPDVHCSHFMRWYGEYGALFGYSLLEDNQEVDPRFFYSCNISMKRNFVTKHGAFNERLTVLEDNELGFRLARQGLQLFFRKSAMAYHYQSFTFRQACDRLERYSSGLNAFLATAAGRALAKERRGLSFRSAEIAVRICAPLLRPLTSLIDSNTKLPDAIYRLFYWNYGAYRSFWSRADGHLLRGESVPHSAEVSVK